MSTSTTNFINRPQARTKPIGNMKDNKLIAELKEQLQDNLLTYFDAITLGTQAQHTEAMDGMCDIVIKTINEHEQ
jgi:hypothetical protein|tara:strand:+ start:202 stop:426 length:225 start_codon:yes stop_codon:yes gene_type:complete